MTIVVLTEKPAVARDIAAVLGAKRQSQGFWAGNGYHVTWALGHLVSLAEPHQMNPRWQRWRRDDLPMLPDHWPLVILERSAAQYKIVAKLINDPKTEKVVCATDAGREGELIFRYIYEKAECTKPIDRLWVSSLTPEAIADGFRNLRDGREFEPLAASARARSQADWLVGMNLSRGYSLSHGEPLTVGRVQTPTLAMVVQRELAIQHFVVEDYVVIKAWFRHPEHEPYEAYLYDPTATAKPTTKPTAKRSSTLQAQRFAPDDEQVAAICERNLAVGQAHIQAMRESKQRQQPPQFYDLTELQRQANRVYGLRAEQTLGVAQRLYEKHKLITYPRTDSRYVTQDLGARLGDLATALAARYTAELERPLAIRPLGRRFVDDAGVTDHHAILPTGPQTSPSGLNRDEERIYDLICRRLVMAYLPDHEVMTTLVTLVSESPGDHPGEPWADHFYARGRRIVTAGWKVLEPQQASSAATKLLPSGLREGARQQLEQIKGIKRQTQPPSRLNDASLLTAMETAGSTLDDKELSSAMRERGLGTPATRSAIIENLLKRQYMSREGRAFRATPKGIKLIAAVHEAVKSPALTGEWELKLQQISQQQLTLHEFTEDIISFVRRTTRESLRQPRQDVVAVEDKATGGQTTGTSAPKAGGSQPVAPVSADQLLPLLQKRFGFDSFRPYQEAVCRDVVQGRDTLLVMPTGAGKSLGYQLPGLAMGGVTLVISPLIALMDDQVGKLQQMGMAAAAIHSGKEREVSRQICRQYAAGQLDFLFIAPERLAVPGFVDFLSRFKPKLIAIDEAHCISHWGHDFRYDYRRLTERLAPLRPAVMIAMTATATARVQQDIIDQLALKQPASHIRGFRRTNIAIENVEVSKKHRQQKLLSILQDPGRLPAIVYAPTRKEAESAAGQITQHLRGAAYHAGMDPAVRNQVQDAFLAGQLDVIVATTAFGMGVDKPDIRTVVHLAVPGSLEGYYQEIGRAGRDGQPSRAILLYSYGDLKTHEYFHKQNYPDVRELREVFQQIPTKGIARAEIDLKMPPAEVDNHLARLVMIGALQFEQDRYLPAQRRRQWESRYTEQKQYRYDQLMAMHRYVQQTDRCRMLRLMAHFGDPDAQGEPCGLCDICAPAGCLAKSQRSWTPREQQIFRKIVERLAAETRPVALGTLFRDIAEPMGLARRDYQSLLDVLIREGHLRTEEASFNKSGEVIHYRVVALAVSPDVIDWSSLTILEDQSTGSTGGSRRKRSAARQGAVSDPNVDQGLLERLRHWRKEQAKKRRIPAYRILSDRSLLAVAGHKPQDLQSLLTVHGIGPAKAEQFGAELLEVVSRWEQIVS